MVGLHVRHISPKWSFQAVRMPTRRSLRPSNSLSYDPTRLERQSRERSFSHAGPLARNTILCSVKEAENINSNIQTSRKTFLSLRLIINVKTVTVCNRKAPLVILYERLCKALFTIYIHLESDHLAWRTTEIYVRVPLALQFSFRIARKRS